MGKMDGVSDEQFNMVKELLENMCPVDVEENLLGARWSKLLINSTFSGIGTAIGGKYADVFGNKKGRDIAIECMKECIDVGHAAGIEFAMVQGKDITKLFYYTNGIKKAIGKFIMPIAMKKHGEIEPSMLQDLKNGKPCEVDSINGIICEYGKKYNIKTPVNDKIVEIIKMEQSKKIPLDKSNIDLF
jgi:2-dehydropantoate 2-reductase